MKLTLKILASILVVVILGGLILPNNFEIKRSVSIEASNSHIHQFVNNLKKWPQWTPWKESDPSVNVTLGEITQGLGASQSWTANGGGGSLTFTSSSSESGIDYDFFFEGDETRYPASISYSEGQPPITVTWKMSGKVDTLIIGPYVAMMMDPMVGDMFQKGLDKLKKIVENDA